MDYEVREKPESEYGLCFINQSKKATTDDSVTNKTAYGLNSE